MNDEQRELWIEQIQALHLIRGQGEKIDVAVAHRSRRAFMERRKDTDLSEHGPRADLAADFLEPDGSALQIEEFLTGIAFAKNDRVLDRCRGSCAGAASRDPSRRLGFPDLTELTLENGMASNTASCGSAR